MSITVPEFVDTRTIDRRKLTLVDMVYVWRGHRLVIDAGFSTDLASIPRLVRPLFPAISEAREKGAIAHDRLYGSHNWTDGTPCSRKDADRVMFDICVAEGMPVWRALLIRWGLRLGGWVHWRCGS